MFKMQFAAILSLALLTTGSHSLPLLDQCGGGSTNALQSVFAGVIDDSLLPDECVFELVVRPETCAIRIDIGNLEFPQPLRLDEASAFSCSENADRVELKVLGLPVLDLSVLCGSLSGHHINLLAKDYDAPIVTDVVKKLVITVVNAPKLLGGVTSSWNLTLTQLLCNNAVGPVVEEAKHITHSLPPVGCLQYFDAVEGIIESLNYANGLGHYMGNLNYAICFKRHADTCGIKFTGLDIELASNGDASYSTDRDCDTLGLGIDVGLGILPHQDYLVIPNGEAVDVKAGVKLFGSKYCGKSLKLLDVTVKTQGPYFLGFISDGISDLLRSGEIGFKIKYELLKCSHSLL